MYYIISILFTIVAFVLGFVAGFNLGESMQALKSFDDDIK